MERNLTIRTTAIAAISFAYALLFIYAATSKLLDFENFTIQLGQSPLLSAFADWIAITVPLAEYAIALLLLLKAYRIIALFASFALMAMFTAYIYIILHYSSFVPCSCGGVLQKMTWDQHLLFNIIFLVLAAVAVLVAPPRKETKPGLQIKSKAIWLSSFGVGSCVVILLLYNESERIVHYQNTFIRRYPLHVAQERQRLDLKFNSYYLAGAEGRKIYLGNSSTPLVVTVIDTALQNIVKYQINLLQRDLPFKMPLLKITGSAFYFYEGAAPYIFSGNTADWKATLRLSSGTRFTQLTPIGPQFVAVRFMDNKNGENQIGTINLNDTSKVNIATSLLQKQIDGIFDTDGYLHFDTKLNRLVYLYRYRNQYIVATSGLQPDYRGNTIDTVTHAHISLVKNKTTGMTTYARPPLIVNKMSALNEERLFVNSTLPGKFEKDQLWKTASIIDVYDLKSKTYQSSFPIYHIGNNRLDSFIVRGNNLYAIVGTALVHYTLLPHLTGNGPGTNNNR